VFETKVLRRIFGPKMNEIIGWGKLHIEELHNMYSSPTIITHQVKEVMGRACSTHGRKGFGGKI
jgi:hypothetical protein